MVDLLVSQYCNGNVSTANAIPMDMNMMAIVIGILNLIFGLAQLNEKPILIISKNDSINVS